MGKVAAQKASASSFPVLPVQLEQGQLERGHSVFCPNWFVTFARSLPAAASLPFLCTPLLGRVEGMQGWIPSAACSVGHGQLLGQSMPLAASPLQPYHVGLLSWPSHWGRMHTPGSATAQIPPRHPKTESGREDTDPGVKILAATVPCAFQMSPPSIMCLL